MEYQICKTLPGTSLASLDETDIETLLGFVLFIVSKNEKEDGQYTVINGKRYKKVSSFSQKL